MMRVKEPPASWLCPSTTFCTSSATPLVIDTCTRLCNAFLQWGWAGNYALGASYIALPWWAGQALFGELSLDVMVLTVLYSLAGLGIAIVNDFKVGAHSSVSICECLPACARGIYVPGP